MKNIVLIIYLLFSIQSIFSQSVLKSMRRLPDTGENTSYTSTFGEDNDYNFNTPFFILNANGTVTDTITQLMWQQTEGAEMTYANAKIYCDTLTLGGYTDWRLPNAHESFSILNHQYANPSLDLTVFSPTSAEYWWTGTLQSNDSNKVWVTNAGGGIGNHPKTETISAGGSKRFQVRAVRDITVPQMIANHFTDNGDGTITDHLTDLIWTKSPYIDSITWEQALSYADTLLYAGANDWRIPNIKELQSINEEVLINPSINSVFFNSTHANKFWSSTTLPNQTNKSWYLDSQYGITTYDLKTNRHLIFCVRNKNVNTNINIIDNSKLIVYPNPFHAFINIVKTNGNEIYELVNNIGGVIYSGKNIQQQDFTDLAKGIYFLKINNNTNSIVKLVKE